MSSFTLDLRRVRFAASPRYAPPPTPRRAMLIHGGIMLLWAVLFLRAFGARGTFAWSIGLAYVSYDTALLLFVFLQTLPLRHPSECGATTGAEHKFLGLGVIVAAHNEAAVLPLSLTALFAQTVPPDEVVIADDGSDDATADLLTGTYGLVRPALGNMSAASPHHPALRWLRLPHGGKARALKACAAERNRKVA